MGIIKEPLKVDFVVDARPLTKAEEEAITDFIRADKKKRKLKELKVTTLVRQKEKQFVL